MMLAVLFAIGPMVEAVKLNSLQSLEIWGQLRAGGWVLENHRIPRTALFSQSERLPWRDFSWGFDVIAATTYKIAGLRAVPALAMGFRVGLAVVLFLLAGARRGDLWGAGLLTLVGLYTLAGPGPASTAASVVLFGVEVLILLEWRRSPSTFRAAVALLVLFLVWANLDIGFVYGIALLAIYVASLFAQPIAGGPADEIAKKSMARTAAVVLLSCVIVSGVTPYGYASYPAFWEMETSAANASIPGYAAMGFRQPLDYIVLLLAMSAFLAMGLRRSRDIFLVALLSGSAMLSFHSQREGWLIVVSAVAVVGCMLTEPQGSHNVQNAELWERRLFLAAGSSLALVILVFLLAIPRDPKVLLARIGKTLPVKACDFIRSADLAHPLFNAYGWGSFVSWYLPEYPVAIDSRRGLYSEEMEDSYFKVMKADVPYQSLPAMRDAKTLLLEKSNVMAQALKSVQGFHVAYEDDVAILLSQGGKP